MEFSPKDYNSRYDIYKEIIDYAEQIENVSLPAHEDIQYELNSSQKEIQKNGENIKSSAKGLIDRLTDDMDEDLTVASSNYIEYILTGEAEDGFPFSSWAEEFSKCGRKMEAYWLTNIIDKIRPDTPERQAMILENMVNFLQAAKEHNKVSLKRFYTEIKKRHEKEEWILSLFENLSFASSVYSYINRIREPEEKYEKIKLNNWNIYANMELMLAIEEQDFKKTRELVEKIRTVHVDMPEKSEKVIQEIVQFYFTNPDLAPRTFFECGYNNSYKNYMIKNIKWDNIAQFVEFDKENDMGFTQYMLPVFENLIKKHDYELSKTKIDHKMEYERIAAYVRAFEMSKILPVKESLVKRSKI